jgi:hypothetical protein
MYIIHLCKQPLKSSLKKMIFIIKIIEDFLFLLFLKENRIVKDSFLNKSNHNS